jgi:heme/copper-type cytochrome/quinol oxidase subunit 4
MNPFRRNRVSNPSKNSSPYNQGYIIFVVLMALTIIEYLLALPGNLTIPLLLVALVKMGIIMNFFMHIARVWNPEDGH